jgi:uncharacterized protein YndB with AHSA1/START domain
MKVQRSVVLPAPPEEVWPALTEPDRLGGWLDAEVELDSRQGGRVVVVDEVGERWGTVEWFEPFRMLVLRLWEKSDRLSGSRVEFTLDGVEEGTLLTVVESRIDSGRGDWGGRREPVSVGRG